MTAFIGTAANIQRGFVQQSNVTNTYAGYFISGGSALSFVLPWQADKFEWMNYTKYATNDTNLQGVWYRDFPAGDALIVARGTTTLTSTLETTNGVTIANIAGGFVNQHLVITNITTATPAVVTTSTPHALVDLDRGIITKVIGTMASQINNYEYVVDVLSSTTFALYDTYGIPITTLGAYTSSGQWTKEGPRLGIVDVPTVYILTLGTAVVGADGDKIYFEATQFNSYVNLGDLGA